MNSSLSLNSITPKLLANIPFFKDLELEYIEMLAKKMEIVEVNANGLIISEGDSSVGMYFIIKGIVKVYRKTSRGRIENICELNSPNFFGEMSIIDGKPRSASVEAMTNTVLAKLNWDDVKDIFKNKPEIMCYILKNIGYTLSIRLRRVNTLYSNLALV